MSTQLIRDQGDLPILKSEYVLPERGCDLAALLAEETKYRILIEHIPAITYIAAMDKASSTLYISPQIEAILGFSRDQWMADPTLWLKQIHPDDRTFVLRELARIRQGGDPKPCEYRMLTRDGQVVWLRDDAAVLRDNQRRPLALYGVMLDITTRKRLEDKLVETQRKLGEAQKPRLDERELAVLRLVQDGRKDSEIGQHQLAARVEAERLHLARELHDNAVQQLLGLSYQLATTQERARTALSNNGQQSDHLSNTLDALRQDVLGVVRQLRACIGELRPAGLDDLGLTAAIEGYVTCLERERGPALPTIRLDLAQIGPSLPPTIALCLFRAAQEALRNALRHAQADRISLCLHLQTDVVVLRVWDNGCGFCVPRCLNELVRANHFGLVGIAERVAWVKGQLSIHSSPQAGTEVMVRIPLRHGKDRSDISNSCPTGG